MQSPAGPSDHFNNFLVVLVELAQREVAHSMVDYIEPRLNVNE